MPITHVNRKGKTYYLHIGKTKSGKDKYYFSTKSDGTLAETIPDGYEIYENPNAQVFLRIILPKLITDTERAVVETGMKTYSKIKNCQIDIRGENITIYLPDQNETGFSDIIRSLCLATGKSEELIDEIAKKTFSFTPVLRFILTDEEKRRFVVQRYCFRGSIDDWIFIGGPDSLENLVKKFIKHLGQESLYDFLPEA